MINVKANVAVDVEEKISALQSEGNSNLTIANLAYPLIIKGK